MDKPDIIPLGSVTTITTEGAGRAARHTCDDCGGRLASRPAASAHTRSEHRSVAAFGPAAASIRQRRAQEEA